MDADLARRAALLGLAAGLRSSLGIAAPWVSGLWVPAGDGGRRTPRLLAAGALVVGELIGDKLPQTPSRLAPAGLLPRIATGAYGASVLARRCGRPALPALALGAGASVVGAYAGHSWRAAIAGHDLPDLPAALAEDAVALVAAAAATRTLPN
ncbi:hypothetical protein SAMN05444695_10457 [Rhodococcus triatomae]|uniref:DUF4126 domain-containing protein n=2 Tax=Rhodococcus triatomae TaxID=300028 RepID=A0A1G8GD88_9NOCA|nr:hypothetical protein SAMN05444695_10457 [Rhodococcus triatomae]